MGIAQSIILGLIQGITEFLPISSSGHLVLTERLLNVKAGDIVFEVMVHLGTLAAVIIYYRQELFEIFRSLIRPFSKQIRSDTDAANLKMAWFLVLGTIPAVLFGVFFKDIVERAFASPRWTSGEFILTGVLLISTIWAREKGKVLNNWNTLFIGVAQAIAIMPAISRSGSTIAAGMFSGINKERAAEFSFLLSIPAIIGATVFQAPDFIKLLPHPTVILIYLAGTIVSGVVGYLSIKILLDIIKRGKFFYFGIYCIILGITGLLLF
jgi:undecaprenyl-diphosphatase